MLGLTAGAAGAMSFGTLLQPAVSDELAQKEKQVLLVWTDGGMSQFESWDPKPNTEFGGPFRPISTSIPGVEVSELLPKTSKLMHLLAVVRSMSTQDNSHSAGVPRILRGDPKNRGVTYPYLGSAVAKLMGPTKSGLPPYVWIKPGSSGFIHDHAGFLGPKFGALAFGDGKPPENLQRMASLNDDEATGREALRVAANRRYANRRRPVFNEAYDYVYDVAHKLMQRQDLFDTASFDPKDVERYGTHNFGQHMLQARKMLEAGVRFVSVTSYGWDTHADNFHGHQRLVPRFDQAFAAMLEDLRDRGMLDHVLVIAMSEFGRTPKISGSVGRDHWPECWSLAMAGAGIRAGTVIGKTNANGTWVDGEAYDIGHMLHTWFRALGISADTQYMNGTQPLPLAHDECHAVNELLA
jgi:hypothetical protein